MMKTAKSLLIVLLASFASSAFAETSQLKISGDLMIHPKQIADFFALASKKIDASSAWDWQALTFDKPYKTSWGNVQARGPFQVRFATANLARQEVGFELDWNEPVVHVGRFEIHDTLVRDIGGARIIINLDGACNGMQMRIPSGQWKVRGTLKWGWSNAGVQVAWQDFQFINNPGAQASVELGQCEGPAALQQELKDAILKVSQDQSWTQDVMRDGILNWVEGSFNDLQVELLKTRDVPLRPGLTLSWQPQNMFDVGNGRMRIAGQVVLSKESKAAGVETLERSFSETLLADVTESGFVLPRDTVPKTIAFLQRHGELGYRANSNQVESFVGLMKSRFLQFFVWPDLMRFAKTTQFYFDVSSESAPVLSGGASTLDGIVYKVQAPLLVRQWAPTNKQYLPYVDFRTPMRGQVAVKVEEGELRVQLQTEKLNVKAAFRSEFKLFRAVQEYIATSLLGSRVADYLNTNPFSLTVPAWKLGEGLNLGMKDVKLQDQSLRIPLEIK